MTLGGARTPDGLQDVLRRYLAQNPEAADTMEGIKRWWLPEAMRSVSDSVLQQALAGLVAAGEMRAHALPDGNEFFSRSDPTRPITKPGVGT